MENRKRNIRLLSFKELTDFILSINVEKYRAKQIYEWIWQKNINSFEEILNIPKALKNKLDENFSINRLTCISENISNDKTVKFAFKTYDNKLIESVLIPNENRSTACISIQTGCALNCSFCATAKVKELRNLNISEIIDQVLELNLNSINNLNHKLSNIVYMGMGEPLLNYQNLLDSIKLITSEYGLNFSPTRITVSTSGISNMIKQLADDNVKFNLAISLHSAIDNIRSELMPINKKFNLNSLTESIKYYHSKTKQRITFEYLLLKNVNDSIKDAKALAEYCKSFPCKINIIEFNKVEDKSISKSNESTKEKFINYLKSKNLIVNIRNSRGQDINAACGQLANIIKNNNSA